MRRGPDAVLFTLPYSYRNLQYGRVTNGASLEGEIVNDTRNLLRRREAGLQSEVMHRSVRCPDPYLLFEGDCVLVLSRQTKERTMCNPRNDFLFLHVMVTER